SQVEGDLRGYDACYFCLGVSSAGMDEAKYARITYDLTLAAAEVLARLNPQMTFVYAVTSMLAGWLIPLLRAMFPRRILTTESVGQAMLAVARRGAPQAI